MEVKKIVEGMTAQEVAQIIDENFRGLDVEMAEYIFDINRREYVSLAYSGGFINIDNVNKKFVVVGNLVMCDSKGSYVIPDGSEFPFGTPWDSNAQALIFDKGKKELYCRTWSYPKDSSSIIASLYAPDLYNVIQVNATSVHIRIDGKSTETEVLDVKKHIEDLTIPEVIRESILIHYTHAEAGSGVYVKSNERNAVIKPLRFDYDVHLTTDANHKLAAQIYDSNKTGAEHLISDDRVWTIGATRTIPANTWFCFIVANIDDSQTDQSTSDSLIITSCKPINKSVLELANKTKDLRKNIEEYDRIYQGEPLKIVSKYRKKEEFSLDGLGWNQSGTNYKEYGIFFNNEKQLAYLHNIDENKLLAELNIPSGSYFKPHCNVASIGSEFASSNSIMPLIYVSQWDIGYEKALFAYDITFNGSEYGIRLHQIIKFNQVSESLIGAGQCDMVVDSDFGFIYTMAYNVRHTFYEEENSTPVCKVMLPTYNQGNLVDGVYEVVITDEDVLDNFVLPRLDTRQDSVCNGGNIILACGYVGYRDNTKIIVIDTVKKEIVTTIPLGKYEDIEPETLLIHKNKLLMTRGNTIFYSIDTY